MKSFFISYTGADHAWAEWVAWQLEAHGYSAIIQAWDFSAGQNFVVEMQKAAREAESTIAILSPDYLAARFTVPEWTAAFAQDPTGERGKLIPVRVKKCDPTGLLPQIVYIDLTGKSENAARKALIDGVSRRRGKPSVQPIFPARRGSSTRQTVDYPSRYGESMPHLERFVELFRSENIFQKVPGLAKDLVANLKAASTGSILLDNSTIEYAIGTLFEREHFCFYSSAI
jgi:hypothetical protein